MFTSIFTIFSKDFYTLQISPDFIEDLYSIQITPDVLKTYIQFKFHQII